MGLGLFVPGNSIFAQNGWSLNDCIAYALDNNIELKRSELNADISRNNFRNSKLQILPSLNAFSNTTQNWGRTFSFDVLAYVDQNYLDGNFGVQSSITLFDGLQKINTIGQRKYSYLSSLAETDQRRNEISISVATSYLQILLDSELLLLAEDQLELSSQQVDRTKRMVEVGNFAKGELLEMEAQAAMDRSDLIQARNRLSFSYLVLAQMLNIDSIDEFEIRVPDEMTLDEAYTSKSITTIYEKALEVIPAVKSAEYNKKSQEKALSVARGMRSPNIDVTYTNFSRYNELAIHPSNYDSDPTNDVDNYIIFPDQIRDFEYKALQLSVQIPIFNHWDIQTQISNAKVSVYDSKLNLDLTKQVLFQEIQQAYADILAAYSNFIAKEESVGSTEEAFRYAEEKYNVGAANTLEYNTARNNLSQARSDLVQAKYDYIFKTKVLDFYEGTEIEL